MKRRCQRLDQYAKRCGHMALRKPFLYHGDGELYSGFDDRSVVWVSAYLCEQCAWSAAAREMRERGESR